MSTDSLPRDFYDLNYERSHRRRRPIVPEGEISDPLDEFEVTLVPLDPLNIRLNQLSKALRNQLQKKDALIFGLSFLNCALETPMDMSVYAAMPLAIAQPLPSRSDSDKEEELLINRIEWSRMDQIGDQVLRQSVRLLGDAVRLKKREHGDCPEYPNLLYRLHSPESHTFYANDMGFCSARWLHQRNFDNPSAQDFLDHCNREKKFHSPYISMTESPWRLLRFAKYEPSAADVFIVDANRLWATRIQFQRTTQLARQWNIGYTGVQYQAQVQFVTETHWIAEGWIPHDCIAKRVPLEQFRNICMTKGIATGHEKVRMEGLRLELRDFDRVASGRRRKTRAGQAQALEEGQNDLARRAKDLSIHST